jgi:hypothetical protein
VVTGNFRTEDLLDGRSTEKWRNFPVPPSEFLPFPGGIPTNLYQLSNDVASLDFPASLELHVVLDGCHTVDIACDLDRPVDVVS